jgi:hypothetical protein
MTKENIQFILAGLGRTTTLWAQGRRRFDGVVRMTTSWAQGGRWCRGLGNGAGCIASRAHELLHPCGAPPWDAPPWRTTPSAAPPWREPPQATLSPTRATRWFHGLLLTDGSSGKPCASGRVALLWWTAWPPCSTSWTHRSSACHHDLDGSSAHR